MPLLYGPGECPASVQPRLKGWFLCGGSTDHARQPIPEIDDGGHKRVVVIFRHVDAFAGQGLAEHPLTEVLLQVCPTN